MIGGLRDAGDITSTMSDALMMSVNPLPANENDNLNLFNLPIERASMSVRRGRMAVVVVGGRNG